MKDEQTLDLTNIAGLNIIKLGDNHYELAVPDTDINFTLIYHAGNKDTFKYINPGSLIWFISLNDNMCVVEWVGDKTHFLKDSMIVCNKILTAIKRENRNYRYFSVSICKVISVDDSNTGVIEFISENKQDVGVHYKVSRNAVSKMVDIDRIN